jgi:hypothetical protein
MLEVEFQAPRGALIEVTHDPLHSGEENSGVGADDLCIVQRASISLELDRLPFMVEEHCCDRARNAREAISEDLLERQ